MAVPGTARQLELRCWAPPSAGPYRVRRPSPLRGLVPPGLRSLALPPSGRRIRILRPKRTTWPPTGPAASTNDTSAVHPSRRLNPKPHPGTPMIRLTVQHASPCRSGREVPPELVCPLNDPDATRFVPGRPPPMHGSHSPPSHRTSSPRLRRTRDWSFRTAFSCEQRYCRPEAPSFRRRWRRRSDACVPNRC